MRRAVKRAVTAFTCKARHNNFAHGCGKIPLNLGLLRQIADFFQVKRCFKTARYRLVKPQKSFYKRAFARAVFTYNAKVIALIYRKAYIFRNGFSVIPQR